MAVHVYVAAVGAAFVCTYLMSKLCRKIRQRHYEVPARDISKGHRWCMADSFDSPTFCNISEEPISHGAYCDCCGICVEDHCMKEANKRIHCKDLSSLHDQSVHHWIKGNLPEYSVCTQCGEECGHFTELCDFRCVWCKRVVHENCIAKVSSYCDLGEFRDFIIPANCVRLKQVGIKGRRHWIVSSVRQPSMTNWKPLIVIANRKSGNNDGELILQAFRKILNPAQVIDLSEIPPECGLEWCHLLPHVTCRILVAGGDGTIGWVLSAIDKLKLKPAPQVCILPLGTGNDLSRVLGWGEGYTAGDVDVSEILHQMEHSKVVMLDRWNVEITPTKHFGFRMPKKNLVMNNYASIGVDALVTLNFHRHRESRPLLFGSRLLNKFWYFTYGTKDVLERECKDLHKKLKVELDGRLVDLPEIEGVVVLNIASWGGGCRPWAISADTNTPQAAFDDGLMEVFALYSSFHIAQLQVSLAEPLRLGQARHVKITLSKGNAPMQVDGEPWEQHPGTIILSHRNQATMLANITDVDQ